MAFYEIGKTYTGKVCKKCGGKVRYANSRRCVACKHELSKAEWERKQTTEKVMERHEID